MIPHRMLSSEICGSGLKNRVTACRNRLRVSRIRHKPLARDEDAELFPETTAVFSFESCDRSDTEALLLDREQEVGIT
jgi:hypothetical protein